MNRDIVCKTQLNAEEFVALGRIADDLGLSMSAMIRSLVKREISAHATRLLAQQRSDSAESGQESS